MSLISKEQARILLLGLAEPTTEHRRTEAIGVVLDLLTEDRNQSGDYSTATSDLVSRADIEAVRIDRPRRRTDPPFDDDPDTPFDVRPPDPPERVHRYGDAVPGER